MKQIYSKFLIFLFITQAMAHEELPLPSKPSQVPHVKIHRKILYGSFSIAPGAGLSNRERNGSKGTALDYKVGVLPFVFDTMTLIPIVSLDYNFLSFSKDESPSHYFSWGIGAAYVIPYIPIRAGIEFEKGFIDIGAKLVWGFIPSPEIRAGFDLKF